MFVNSAELYDLIYSSFKDYGAESALVHKTIAEHKKSNGMKLLDVACGTGHHLEFLKRLYDAEGLDLDEGLLKVARKRHENIPLHQGNMINFRLENKFDAVVCLFSAIGYVETKENLNKAVETMADHLKPGGVLLVEPWLKPDAYREGLPFAIFVENENLKVSRMNVSRIDNGVSVLHFHYLVASPAGVTYFTEEHRLGLFEHEDYMQAFRNAGLKVSYDLAGFAGRGLYIGVHAN